MICFKEMKLNEEESIYVGKQDFDNNTVEVAYNGKRFDCPLFSDKGNIGFVFENQEFYFSNFVG